MSATIGRPRKWQEPEELQTAIDAYFATCDAEKRPYTVTGLALALDTNRQTLLRWETGEYSEADGSNAFDCDSRFRDSIKRAKARCENWLEEAMLTRDRQVAGHIFSAKNNYGWRDESQVSVNVGIAVGMQRPIEPPMLEARPITALEGQIAPDANLSPVPRNDLACAKVV